MIPVRWSRGGIFLMLMTIFRDFHHATEYFAGSSNCFYKMFIEKKIGQLRDTKWNNYLFFFVFRLSELERLLHCQAETASELLNIFVYGVRPREQLLEYKLLDQKTPISLFMQQRLKAALGFLQDIDGEVSARYSFEISVRFWS